MRRLWKKAPFAVFYGVGSSIALGVAAFLVTSLLFAATHYQNYFLQHEGIESIIVFCFYVMSGLILGWFRWRSGNTTVSIIGHILMNLLVNEAPVVASALLP